MKPSSCDTVSYTIHVRAASQLHTMYLEGDPMMWMLPLYNQQDLSPDRIARLILYILFLENSVRDLDFDMTWVCVCVCVCVCGGGGGEQYLSLYQIGTKSIM